MFEEADAVCDARSFLMGTGNSSAFALEGLAESALGPSPAPEPCVRAPSSGAAGSGCEHLLPAGRRAPVARVASVLISLGYYIRCHGEERGEREARRRGRSGLPRVAGSVKRQGRAGTHLCALRSPCGRRPRACQGGVGEHPCPPLPSQPQEHSGRGRNVLFPLRPLSWVYTFLAPGVCTLKHLFNIKEAACAAVIVRPERVAVSSRAVNESSPRGPGLDDSCGVHTRARTRRVPQTQGERPFCSDDAWRGGGELVQKGGGFPPLPQ